jgi:ribose-phosphate pyrophosphokinase
MHKNRWTILPADEQKINKLYDEIATLANGIIKCDKVRNMATGQLSNFEVFSKDLMGTNCLIVDDICDGGRTFIGVADELKKKNAGNIYLFVTHGIFSNGLDELKKHFTRIYTTNSVKDINDDFITQFNLYV